MVLLGAPVYVEKFDKGPGGWLGWVSNAAGAARLEIREGSLYSSSPWWIDYNHAPPGGGYLHLLYALHTWHWPNFPRQYKELGGPNHFVLGGFPRDFRNAKVSARMKADVRLRGAECLLLVQSKVRGTYINIVLTGQPFRLTRDWSWQRVTLTTDPSQWKAMGSRHDRMRTYAGEAQVAEVLADVNADIICVLHPLDVRPKGKLEGDMHKLKAGEDYEVDRSRLPEGWVMMDEVRIEFAEGSK
jgi:hypothetical protein